MSSGRPATHCKKHLLLKGLQLFNQQGYHNTRLQQLLQCCGVPKGTFYNFFSSKDGFALAIIENYFQLEAERLSITAELPQASHFQKIYKYWEIQIETYGTETDRIATLIANLSAEMPLGSTKLRLAILKTRADIIQVITEDMQICQQEGSIRNDVTPRALAEFIWCGWQGALLSVRLCKNTAPLQEFLKTLRLLEQAPGS